MKRIFSKPTPATVIACIALFVSLGGVGYAAATIGSAQIKNNSIKSTDIRNGTIVSKDIKASTRRALRGQTGPAGVAGPKGDAGATNVTVRAGSTVAIVDNANATATASCEGGERATGGGYTLPPGTTSTETHVRDDRPTQTSGVPTGWTAQAYNEAGGDPTGQIQAYVICSAP